MATLNNQMVNVPSFFHQQKTAKGSPVAHPTRQTNDSPGGRLPGNGIVETVIHPIPSDYPLVNIYITMENHHF